MVSGTGDGMLTIGEGDIDEVRMPAAITAGSSATSPQIVLMPSGSRTILDLTTFVNPSVLVESAITISNFD